MNEEDIKKMIQDEIKKATGFNNRKLTDTPTDSLMYVNRGYVTANGTSANRPTSSVAVIGQRYYDTTVNIPIVWDGTKWRNGVGSIV